MDRRRFLHGALGSATLPLFPSRAHADDAWAAQFAERAEGAAWLRPFAGLTSDVEPMPLTLLHGRIPQALHGSFYRNGPARHELGGVRYRHWFDGDGMVQQYRISERGITHHARFVRTEKFLAESQAGRFTRSAFGTTPPGAEEPSSPDSVNVANTSVVHHGGDLLALWEGGSATRIDADTLDTLGLKTLNDEYAGMPFSAHPKVEADGTMWNFGVSAMQGMLSIYRLGASGRLEQAHTMPLPAAAMVHDFAVTASKLVFLLPPFVFDGERRRSGATFLASHVWHAKQPLRVLVVEKNDLSRHRWFELPTGFVFHTANAWEERGRVHVGYMRFDDVSLAVGEFSQLMRGEYQRTTPPRVALAELDLATGATRQSVLPPAAEFPRVDPSHLGRRYRQLFCLGRSGSAAHPWFDSVQRIDVERGTVDRYTFDGQQMLEEHLFVPAARGRRREGEGWLLGTGYDVKRGAMMLNAFDAERLSAGPVLQATMPRAMPLGLHATFVPA
jgi:carotenoid cleavage dioxygenase